MAHRRGGRRGRRRGPKRDRKRKRPRGGGTPRRNSPFNDPTGVCDPQTGQSLTGDDDDPDARLRRLIRLSATKALVAGDCAEYKRLMREANEI